MKENSEVGQLMYTWASDLFPINRSLTGDGVRETLGYLKELVPELIVKSIPSGTKVFDWEIPREWNVREASIKDSSNKTIIDFKDNNLHLMGYSTPVEVKLKLSELQGHLYSLPEQPTAIPYITSYYKERWGFCLTENQRKDLKDDVYTVKIDSTLSDGELNYGEVIIPGKTNEEIFISTYVCHPSMANNELSGPVVTTALLQWIKTLDRKYTYRVVFIPETIGSIAYLSQNLEAMKARIKAGFVMTCIGDNKTYSYMPSRYGNTLADKAAKHVLKRHFPEFRKYSFLQRGSDERQYCAPGVDLPVCSVMRSKYGEYPEYHTSLDNLDFISPEGLAGGFEVMKKIILAIEANFTPKVTVLCEPQLGKRGLYPTISTKSSGTEVRDMINAITYSDGTNDLIDIAEIINVDVFDIIPIMDKLVANKLVGVQ